MNESDLITFNHYYEPVVSSPALSTITGSPIESVERMIQETRDDDTSRSVYRDEKSGRWYLTEAGFGLSKRPLSERGLAHLSNVESGFDTFKHLHEDAIRHNMHDKRLFRPEYMLHFIMSDAERKPYSVKAFRAEFGPAEKSYDDIVYSLRQKYPSARKFYECCRPDGDYVMNRQGTVLLVDRILQHADLLFYEPYQTWNRESAKTFIEGYLGCLHREAVNYGNHPQFEDSYDWFQSVKHILGTNCRECEDDMQYFGCQL